MFFHRFETREAFVGNLLIAVPIAHQMRQILFSTRLRACLSLSPGTQAQPLAIQKPSSPKGAV
jgi:hypothetical protein